MKLKAAFSRMGFGGAMGALLATTAGVVPATKWIGLKFEHLSYDIPYTICAPVKTDGVVIVYIDDDSYENLNQPKNAPLDRHLHARLIDRLKAEGAKAAVFDVVFSDPSNPAADADFARAIKEFGKVILAADDVPAASSQGAASGRQLVPPAPVFMDAAAGIGVDLLEPDEDLVVRQHYHGERDGLAASLSWATAEFLGLKVTKEDAKHAGEYWVRYYGPPQSIRNVSYYQAVGGDLPAGFFKDQVVFVGSHMFTKLSSERKDEYPSPYPLWLLDKGRRFMPGVEIHATEFLNLSRGEWLSRLSQLNFMTALIAAGVVLGFGIAQPRPIGAVVVSVLSLSGIIVLAVYLMSYRWLWFPWMIMAGAQITVALLWSVAFNSVQLYVQKRLMEQSLSMYVSPRRVRQIAQRQEILKPGAEKQELSILFSDIAGFTSISEGMDSDKLARVMNNYFENAVTNCIHQADGTVVKFIGDAIFAIWNAPEEQPNHPELAARGALLLRDQVTRSSDDPASLKLQTRIGLHCGVANVGNFGSSTRIDYTAIGENINLASRMEGLNKYLRTTLLATGDIYHKVSDKFVARFAGHFRLKGFEKVVEVYELLAPIDQAAASRDWREAFQAALEQFQKRSFPAAATGFQRVVQLHPDDGPAAFYLNQIEEFRTAPPPEDWAGEIELKEK